MRAEMRTLRVRVCELRSRGFRGVLFGVTRCRRGNEFSDFEKCAGTGRLRGIMNRVTRLLVSVLGVVFAQAGALAWDYDGHRAVNLLAIAGLPQEFPNFVNMPEFKERIAFLSGEPDRLRNTVENSLKNCNHPEHFLDIEEAEDAGFRIEELSPFRYVFIVDFNRARLADPVRFPPSPPNRNKDGTRDLCGTLPWAVMENYAKLEAVFSHIKTLQRDKAPPEEMYQAQAAAATIMGLMGHYIGDATQPLHVTKHHHGWSGANPKEYYTKPGIHAWIDGGFFAQTKFNVRRLMPSARRAFTLPPVLPEDKSSVRSPLYDTLLVWLLDQQKEVEPLYRLVKTGALLPVKEGGAPTPEAVAFLDEQLLRAAQMLSSVWLSAWANARPAELKRPDDTALYQRAVAKVALASLPKSYPEFARSRQAAAEIDYLVTLPERWRDTASLQLRHADTPERRGDFDALELAGMELDELSDLRNRHIVEFARARAENAGKFAAVDASEDRARTSQLPGLLPWLVLENFARVNSAFSYLKVFEEEGGYPEEIENARRNVITYMGQLAAAVADASQPSRLTRDKLPSGLELSAWTATDAFRAHFLELQKQARAGQAQHLPRPPERFNSPPRRSPYFPFVFSWMDAQYREVPSFKKLKDAASAQAAIEEQILRAAEMLSTLWQTAQQEVTVDSYLTRELRERAGK